MRREETKREGVKRDRPWVVAEPRITFCVSRFTFHAILVCLALVGVAQGRTITLDSSASDAMAMICAAAPRLSWAGYEAKPGLFSPAELHLDSGRSLLMHYNLQEIPAGMRVVKAEWIIPVEAVSPPEVRLYVWRMSAEWGPGVCHDYRMVDSKAVPWAAPGGRGSGADRSAKPVAIVRAVAEAEASARNKKRPPEVLPVATGVLTVNVTEEVSLWLSGAVPNYGWMISVEDAGSQAHLPSPIGRGRSTWRLRITYEPQ